MRLAMRHTSRQSRAAGFILVTEQPRVYGLRMAAYYKKNEEM